MVDDRITDGRRIAELLASEIDGRVDDELEWLAVTNADRDVEPTVDGTRAFDVSIVGSGKGSGDESEPAPSVEPDTSTRLARVFLHPNRVHLEFDRGREAAVDAAEAADLRTRPKASTPPKTLVFLESGASVKRGVAVVQAAFRGAVETE
ncbi:hypothetical protein [Natronosalvus vescus]|uniref:hypothetical protein n=1 Tax=Natronosalvus vescus TaxID=2953881 RepID=UPI002091A6E0|nr:hypothetical protein [Natronosalvus vescus]